MNGRSVVSSFSGCLLPLLICAASMAMPGCSSAPQDIQIVDSGWSFAVGVRGDSVRDAEKYVFSTAAGLEELAPLVPGGYGVLWLKNSFPIHAELPGKNISILSDCINPGDEAYFNGHLVGSSGRVDDRDGMNFSDWNSARKYDVDGGFVRAGENTMLVRIFVNHEGGFNGRLYVGHGDPIRRLYLEKVFFRTTLNVIITSITLFISLYYLFMWFKRPSDRSALYYVMLCFFVSIYQTNLFNTLFPFDLSSLMSYLTYQKIIFASMCGVAFSGILFFHAFTEQRDRRNIEIGIVAICCVSALVLTAIPSYELFLLVRRYVVSVVGIGAAGYVLVWSAVLVARRNPHIRSYLAGLVPFMLCVLSDVFFHNILNFSNAIYLSFLGMPAFMVAIAFAMGSKHVELYREVARLNAGLEQKVFDRTRELVEANRTIEEANRRLRVMSQIDHLTQIFNRRCFMENLDVEFERARRYGNDLSFIMFDIDHFKWVNDTYGHPAGDAVLRDVASCVRSSLRKSDIVGRYGGEEFSVVLPQTHPDTIAGIAEKLRRGIELLRFESDGRAFSVTASFGVTELRGEDPAPSAVIERADKALYLAKHGGRNRIESA